MAGSAVKSTRTTLMKVKRVAVHFLTINYFTNSDTFIATPTMIIIITSTFFLLYMCIGVYTCSQCGNELFYSTKKYEHASPWPAFTETVRPDSVSKYNESRSALKVSCGKCGNGLGHEFLNDGPTQGQSRF